MKKAISIAVTLALCALIGPTLAGAGKTAASASTAGYRLNTTMTAKQMTKPRPVGNVAKARGALAGVVTVAKSSTATWTLTFSGLTGQVRAAELRYPSCRDRERDPSLRSVRQRREARHDLPLTCGCAGSREAGACRQGRRGPEDEAEPRRRGAGRRQGKGGLGSLCEPGGRVRLSLREARFSSQPAGAAQPVTRNVVVARDTQRPKPALAK